MSKFDIMKIYVIYPIRIVADKLKLCINLLLKREIG